MGNVKKEVKKGLIEAREDTGKFLDDEYSEGLKEQVSILLIWQVRALVVGGRGG
jgi:hypothetical protein